MRHLRTYLGGLLDDALMREKLQLLSISREYLIEMLVGFTVSDSLFVQDEPGSPMLVGLYQRALNTQGSQRTGAFRRLGDTALFISGFFNDHVERSVTGTGYYIGMGTSAYGRASSLTRSEVFAELSRKFPSLVEVLISMSDQTTLRGHQTIDRVFERYMKNPTSPILVDRLVHEKAIPIFGVAAS